MPYLPPSIRERRELPAVFGLLGSWVADPAVTDIVTVGREIWIERGRGWEKAGIHALAEIDALCRGLVSEAGRHLDDAHPIADGRIGNARVHCVLPPVSVNGAALSIRIARENIRSLEVLESEAALTARDVTRLRKAIAAGERILIAGATGVGKTTLLSALIAEVDAQQRVIVIEDVPEVQSSHPHLVSLCVRQANVEGAGEVGLAELVRAALRMRPDWLVMGECRGREIGEFLTALNTGHHGAGTIHARSLDDVANRLVGLGQLAGWSREVTAHQAISAFDRVIFMTVEAGRRRLAGWGRLARDGDNLMVHEDRP